MRLGKMERKLLDRLAKGPAHYRELRRAVNGAGGGFARALRRLEALGLVRYERVVLLVPRRRTGYTECMVKLYRITEKGEALLKAGIAGSGTCG